MKTKGRAVKIGRITLHHEGQARVVNAKNEKEPEARTGSR